MAISPDQSLLDLTARTATADSDLIHVNSEGTDYKETKLDFLQGGLAVDWATDSLLTSQVNALPKGSYFGVILSNNHQTETGVPQNASYYVHAFNYSNASGIIYLTQMNNGDCYYIRKYQSTWESAWTKEPTRSEITSLNSSLTNSPVTISAGSASVSVIRDNSYKYGNIVFLSVRFTVSADIAIYGYVLQLPSSMKTPTDVYVPLMTSYFTPVAGKGVYMDAQSYSLRASSTIPAGSYTLYVPILIT